MAAFSALVALGLTTSLRPEDPPEIEVQPTVIEREIAFDGEPTEFEGAPVKLVGTLTLPTHYGAATIGGRRAVRTVAFGWTL